jgi:RHS repeat-associated protein
LYDATGRKLRKTVSGNGQTEQRDYLDGIEYKDGKPDQFHHSEGTVRRDKDGQFKYYFVLRDHLGNTRVTFSDLNNDDEINEKEEIIQINNYYAFGLNMEGNWNGKDGANKYQYNEKEWNDDFGLGWNDYNTRMYDPAMARFVGIDLMADDYAFQTPYAYAANNPIRYIDFRGMNGEEPQTSSVDLKPVLVTASRLQSPLTALWLGMNMTSSITMDQHGNNPAPPQPQQGSGTATADPSISSKGTPMASVDPPSVVIFANSPSATNPSPAKVVEGDPKIALGFANRMTDKIQAELLDMIKRSKLDMSQTSVDDFIQYVLNNARTFDFKAEDGSGHVGHISGIEAYYLPMNPVGTQRWTDPTHPSLIKPYNAPLNPIFSGGRRIGALEIRNLMSPAGVSLSVERSHNGVITGNGYRLAFLINITAGLEQ